MKDKFLDQEESFYGSDRKGLRQERKRALRADRSKFKKTDQDQLKKQKTTCHEGPWWRVLTILPEGILVDLDGKEQMCQLRGALKREATRLKNLVAVGDLVAVSKEGVITEIKERFSVLSRADNLSRNKEQLIAVNIDQVLITASVVMPTLRPSLLDRYIISCRKGNLTPVIVFNKIDLLEEDEKERALYEELVSTYRSLGIDVVSVSTKTEEGLGQLVELMKGKTSVFSGQSGVGKSSLINYVTNSSFRVGEIVQHTNKGAHVTTTTYLIPLEGGGFCIDTPGIRSFGVWDLKEQEVMSYFTEIAEVAAGCKFPDCMHLEEPECAVKAAVESGEISLLRFASYSALINSCREAYKKR